MKKRYSLSIYNLLGLSLAVYCIYYLLLKNDELPFSIHAVLYGIHHLINHWHVVVVGLLPIYVALMIFGLTLLGLYLGAVLERIVAHLFHHPKKNL